MAVVMAARASLEPSVAMRTRKSADLIVMLVSLSSSIHRQR
jgi:hypothetical protein